MLTINDSFTIKKNEFDITACGEVLVDMISREDTPLADCSNFTRYFGGSPANVVINMQRFQHKTALVSRLGKDTFAEFLLKNLKKENINLDFIQKDQSEPTPVIFVNKSKSTPSWLAYRGAERKLKINEKIYRQIDRSSIFFTGSYILSQNPARESVLKAIERALKKNKIFAFDPSFRSKLWTKPQKGNDLIREILAKADIIKPSLDDAYHLYGKNDPEKYIEKFHNDGAKIVILTLGKNGVLVSDKINEPLHFPVYSEKVIDVTGAGDSFWAGFLSSILRGYKISDSVKIGNAVAAFKIQGIGALSPVPPFSEILAYYNIHPLKGGNLYE